MKDNIQFDNLHEELDHRYTNSLLTHYSGTYEEWLEDEIETKTEQLRGLLSDKQTIMCLIQQVKKLREALGNCFFVLSMRDRDTDKWKHRCQKARELAFEILEETSPTKRG
jgi:hypothetical protein